MRQQFPSLSEISFDTGCVLLLVLLLLGRKSIGDKAVNRGSIKSVLRGDWASRPAM